MTLCPQCGATLQEDGRFCPQCGAALRTQEPGALPEAESAQPASSPEEENLPEDGEAREKIGTGSEERAPEMIEQELEKEEAAGEPEEPQRRGWDRERGEKLLHILGAVFTALGLLILLATALTLFRMHRQQKALALSQQDEGNYTEPLRPQIINYYSRPENGKIRREGQLAFAMDELIVISAPGQSYTDMERFFGERDIRVLGYVELMDAYQILLPETHTLYGLDKIARELEQVDCIAMAAANVLWASGCYTLPQDPWGGSADWEKADHNASNWGLMAIHAPESWERWDAGTARVGLIDLGFDAGQEELRFASLRSGDSRSRAAAEEAENRHHGSAVAAVIGAEPDNGLGLAGAAESCLLCAVESGGLVGQMDVFSAIAELTAQDVPTIQLSLGWREELLAEIAEPQSRAREIYWEKPRKLAALALNRLTESGRNWLLILPAGNGLQGQGLDASLGSVFAGIEEERVRRHILVVGAAELDEDNALRECAFSNRGERVDLLAPGAGIYTVAPGGGYASRSGSSLAAAYVTAAAARAWALNPGLDGETLGRLLVETADTAVVGSDKGLLNMAAALARAAESAETLPGAPEEELARDAYASLLHAGVSMSGRSGAELRAQRYVLTDLDGNGVEELLLYALDEEEQNASFALYGMKDGELTCLCNAWETCRFALWSNMSLTLEIQDGSHIFAAAEKQSAGYGQTGECFWISYNGRRISCVEYDRRQKDAQHLILIENSTLTEQGIRIGSAEDLLWDR